MVNHPEYLQSYPLDAAFPPYLGKGAFGMAVMLLQAVLVTLGYRHPLGDDGAVLQVDGDYGDTTAAAIRKLQLDLGLDDTAMNLDSGFGPATRAAFAQAYHLDVNAIRVPHPSLAGRTRFSRDHQNYSPWAPDEDQARQQIKNLIFFLFPDT